MKRVAGLFEAIFEQENLKEAFLAAAKGKRSRSEVILALDDCDGFCSRLREDVMLGRYRPEPYRRFQIYDPKPREIAAPAFRDRVLHHAIMRQCEPVFDRYAIPNCFACRIGKGVWRALDKVQEQAKTKRWFLKIDIRRYFDSLDQGILMRELSRKFKDERLLSMFHLILRSYETLPGKGLPIGSLMSQHWANFYLGCLDHQILRWGWRCYSRYMDDFILCLPDKATAQQARRLICDFLSQRLALEAKLATIQPLSNGIPFLGFRIFSSRILLLRSRKKRFVAKLKGYHRAFCCGKLGEHSLQSRLTALCSWLDPIASDGLRARVLRQVEV